MKKIIAVLLCLSLLAGALVTLSACSKEKKDESISAGGWQKASSPEVSDEVRAVLEKATEGMTGATYTPVAYLESQIVAGTNHLLLCKCTPVVPDAKDTFVIVSIYEDLSGNAKITSVRSCDFEVAENGEDGAWSAAKSPLVEDALGEAFTKANSVLAGAQYTPVALVATQVVAGTNSLVLCEVKATVPDSAEDYCMVVLGEDLEGNASILETAEFTVEE